MGEFDPVFVRELGTQSWSLYGVGMLLIFFRMYARIHRFGIRNLQPDDYLMLLAGAWYTILITCLNVIVMGGGSNLYPPEQFDTFTQEQIQERVKGSKIVVLSEQAMLNVIYTIKACMLIMYTRLTLHHTQQKLVRYLAIYVAVGWVATEIAFFTACTPFQGYWAMPPPNPQCTTLEHYAIVQACFNISSDTLMLAIPLPLVTRLNIHWKQKLVLGTIFSMGIFVIIAAILTKVFNLMDVWDTSYMLWYTREASVAVYVSNLPMIWPLMREWFPFLRDLTPVVRGTTSKGKSYGVGSAGGAVALATIGSARTVKPGGNSKKYPSKTGVTTTIRGKGESMEDLSSSDETEISGGVIARQDSEERLRPTTGTESVMDQRGFGDGAIHVGTVVQISEEHVVRATPVQNERYTGRKADLELGDGSRGWGYEKMRR